MSVRGFHKLFAELAVSHGWIECNGGWISKLETSDECLIAIETQKSNYGKQFYVGIKVYVQGAFGKTYSPDLRIGEIPPSIYRRLPNEFSEVCDLTNSLKAEERVQGIHRAFEFLNLFSAQAKSKIGLIELEREGQVFIFPALMQEIMRLIGRT
ncbi:MAG: hypothetical protein KDB03_10470 [Planctomycetales bacterium]|nr:hypothetical protein [Planctomycetales bacterium]